MESKKRLRAEENVCMMFNRFLSYAKQEEHKTLILDMKQAFLGIAPVDAVEVVHGRFTNVQGLGDGTCVGFCSNCMTPHKANNLTALRIDYRHCRWCGAKMDGDGNG